MKNPPKLSTHTLLLRDLLAKENPFAGIILEALKKHKSPMLSRTEFQEFIEEHRKMLQIPHSMTARRILDILLEMKRVEELKLDFPFRRETRYVTRALPPLELLMHVYPEAYFSHHTAATINRLLSAAIEQVYLNYEQPSKGTHDETLSQERIDLAFRNRPRLTSNKTRYHDYTVHLIRGKNTNRAGVIQIDAGKDGKLRITNVERTLIDMAVRPSYSGGPAEVLAAYREAEGRASTAVMIDLLNKLDYNYPYHQAIGFYLQTAEVYTESDIAPFKAMEKRFDFYLAHNMKNPNYSKDWRIFYPIDLNATS